VTSTREPWWSAPAVLSATAQPDVLQIEVDGPFFALSNNIGQRAFGLEHFRLIKGNRPADGVVEEDLFAGI